MRLQRAAHRRAGLSLLEVLFATAIFLMALVALMELVTLASNRAWEAKHRTQAALYAQAKMAEVRIGAAALESAGDQPLDYDGDYEWSMDAEQGDYPGIYRVTVRVFRTRPNGSKVESALTELVMDPQFVGSALDTAPNVVAESSADSGSGSGSDPSSGTGDSSGTGSLMGAGGKGGAAGGKGMSGGKGGLGGGKGGGGMSGGKGGGTGGGTRGGGGTTGGTTGGKGGPTGGKGGASGGKGS